MVSAQKGPMHWTVVGVDVVVSGCGGGCDVVVWESQDGMLWLVVVVGWLTRSHCACQLQRDTVIQQRVAVSTCSSCSRCLCSGPRGAWLGRSEQEPLSNPPEAVGVVCRSDLLSKRLRLSACEGGRHWGSWSSAGTWIVFLE